MTRWTARLHHARGAEATVVVEAPDLETAKDYALYRVPGGELLADPEIIEEDQP